MIKIIPLDLHWLDDGISSETDLCAHGGVRVECDSAPLLVSAETDLAVSTGALHLLRTLSRDHTPESPLAEHLIPCCGHAMCIDNRSGELVNVGCSAGLNWWVRHGGDTIELELPQGCRPVIPRGEWRKAVVAFSATIADFYAKSPAKLPEPDLDEPRFRAFWEEWRRRTATQTVAG
jgi:hypothetical protein